MRGIMMWALPLAAVVGLGLGGANVEAQTTQKQWQLVKSGAQGYVLKFAEAPVRQPAAGEVLVKMHAASLNRRDIYVMKGQYPMPPRDVVVPLSDGAGEVVALGSGAKRFRTGDRVMPIFFPKWIEGRPTGDATQLSLGGCFVGVLTVYFTFSVQSLVAVPAVLSFDEAATLPCAGLTAYNGLITRGQMKSGDYVLLEGTGGVSIFGLQFALASRAKPLIISSSDEKLARAKSMGAVGGVNYKTHATWEKNVREITNGAGVQQVLEVGGKDTLPHALASLGPGAHIALIGGLGGFGGEVPAMALMGGNATVSGIYVGSRENFEAMTAFIAQHRMKPVIDKVFDFEDAEAAYQLMEKGNFFGKIVIRL
jgi:NADPH:quinone reductase-like Zn-dependent oxidoreductase